MWHRNFFKLSQCQSHAHFTICKGSGKSYNTIRRYKQSVKFVAIICVKFLLFQYLCGPELSTGRRKAEQTILRQSGGSPTGSLLKRTFASKANVPFSKRTFPFQMERPLPKGNVRFTKGTFPFQMERSLPKWNVRFPKGTFAFQRECFSFFKMRVKT